MDDMLLHVKVPVVDAAALGGEFIFDNQLKQVNTTTTTTTTHAGAVQCSTTTLSLCTTLSKVGLPIVQAVDF